MQTEVIYDINDSTLALAAEVIRKGGLVAFPTETVYGLGANALDPQAAKKIYTAKGRPSDNPLIVHLADYRDADKYACTDGRFFALAEKFMPGPLTVILPKKEIIPYEVTGGLDTVAVRVPSSVTASRLIELAGVPIAAPSANLSTKPSPTMAKHVILDMFGRVDMIIAGEDCEIGLESTIITLAAEKPLILRPGKVTLEEIRKVLPDAEISESVLHKHEGRPESPGMMYKHYAPKAQVTILCGDYGKRLDFLKDKDDCGILCYSDETELAEMPYALSIGSKDKPEEQARLLFARLREFDEIENITEIYAPMPDSDGLGLAVLNRLIRAAGFSVVKL